MAEPEETKIPGKQSDYEFTPAHESELRFEHGAFGVCATPGQRFDGGLKLSIDGPQTLRPPALLEVIIFGKSHFVSPDDYEEHAATYHRLLRKECQILARGIHMAQQCYDEFLYPMEDGFAVYMAGQATVAWMEIVRASPKPDPKVYAQLADRSRELGKALSENDLEYPHVHDMGTQLHKLRTDFARFEGKVALFRDRTIEGAGDITKGLEIVESGAFQVLNLVPTITLMDPFREAAYKISVVILRVSARGAGAWLANSNIVRELLGALKADVPPLVSNLVGGWVSRAMGGANRSRFMTEGVTYITEQIIETIGDLIVAYSNDKKITKDEFHQIAMNRLTATIAKALSICFGGKPNSPRWKQAAGSIAEAAVNTAWRDYLYARDKAAADPNLETLDVLLDELPFTILRFLQAVVTGIANRRASTLAAAGREAGYKQNDGHLLLETQKASAIFGLGEFDVRTAPRGKPLPTLDFDGYRKLETATNLNASVAARIRRYAHDEQEAVIFRLPSEQTRRHLLERSKWPKPVWMKAKTAKSGPNAGLVVTPASGKFTRDATHADYAAANATWVKGYRDLVANGAMIRPDGVVFHPDQVRALPPGADRDLVMQVLDHARRPRGDAGADDANRPQRPYDIDEATGQLRTTEGPPDFYSAAGKMWLMDNYPDRYAQIEDALNGLRVGFYPDIDVDEVVDMKTGDRRVLGDGARDKPGQELEYEQRNRDHLDEAININHDLEVIGDAPGVAGADASRPDGFRRDHPKRHHLVQHGGDSEFVGTPAGGPLVVVLPYTRDNGEPDVMVKVLRSPLSGQAADDDIQRQKEKLLQEWLPEKYMSEVERGFYGRAAWTEGVVKGRHADGPGPRPRTEIFYRVKPRFDRQKEDIENAGRGEACSDNSLIASLLQRGLNQDPARIEKALGGDGAEWVDEARNSLDVLVAFDAAGENVVLATRTAASIDDAVARLARAVALLAVAGTRVTIWPEIYTHFRPRTRGGVMGRLGHLDPEVKPDPALERSTPIFAQRDQETLTAFFAGDFIETYTPPFESARAVGGQVLMAHYEDDASRQSLEAESVTIEDRPVLTFVAAPITCPDSISLQLILDGTVPFPSESGEAEASPLV